MKVADHHGLEELEAWERREPVARRRVRLRTLVLAKRGRTAPQIVEALGISRRSVQRVVERYNREGLAVLDDRPGRGRKQRLSEDQVDAFRQRVDAGPTEVDGVCAFTGEHLRGVLEREFGVLYSLNGVYALLHRHGYSCLMPRPRHEDADPAAQAAFQKTSVNV